MASARDEPSPSTAGTAIDWSALRERLDAARRAEAASTRLDAAATRRILAERARSLAVPTGTAVAGNVHGEDALIVHLPWGTTAIPLAIVVEVARLPRIARVPDAEPPSVGVFGWRGRVLAAARLGGDLGEPPADGRLVVVGEQRAVAGLLVDAVEAIRTLAPEEVAPAASVADSPWVRGMTATGVLVIDGAALVARFTEGT